MSFSPLFPTASSLAGCARPDSIEAAGGSLLSDRSQTREAMDTYFECITTCSIEDGECVTRCVEQLREPA